MQIYPRVHPRKSAVRLVCPSVQVYNSRTMAAPDRVESESNRKLIIVVAVVAAVLIAGVFYVLMQLSSRGPSVDKGLQGAIRAGSPQFDGHKSKIFLHDP